MYARRQKVVSGGFNFLVFKSVSFPGWGRTRGFVGNTMSNIFHSINLMECLHPSISTNMRINQIRSRRFLGRWRLLRMQGKKVTVTCNGTHCRWYKIYSGDCNSTTSTLHHHLADLAPTFSSKHIKLVIWILAIHIVNLNVHGEEIYQACSRVKLSLFFIFCSWVIIEKGKNVFLQITRHHNLSF